MCLVFVGFISEAILKFSHDWFVQNPAQHIILTGPYRDIILMSQSQEVLDILPYPVWSQDRYSWMAEGACIL